AGPGGSEAFYLIEPGNYETWARSQDVLITFRIGHESWTRQYSPIPDGVNAYYKVCGFNDIVYKQGKPQGEHKPLAVDG
ncbi:2111_t:CDS:1, partial [Dentiscutata erythropus]